MLILKSYNSDVNISWGREGSQAAQSPTIFFLPSLVSVEGLPPFPQFSCIYAKNIDVMPTILMPINNKYLCNEVMKFKYPAPRDPHVSLLNVFYLWMCVWITSLFFTKEISFVSVSQVTVVNFSVLHNFFMATYVCDPNFPVYEANPPSQEHLAL